MSSCFEFTSAELKDAEKLMLYQKIFRDVGFKLETFGVKACVSLKNYTPSTRPLCVQDILHLLAKALFDDLSPCLPYWSKLSNAVNISHIVVIVVEDLPKHLFFRHTSLLPKVQDIFSGNILEVVSSSRSLAQEMSETELKKKFVIQKMHSNCEPFSSLFPIEERCDYITEEVGCNRYSKLHLLLNPAQMVMEEYPIPKSIFAGSKSNDYCFTKDSYKPVTVNSPMFAVNCEMCETSFGKELTRIAVVNEDLEVIYTTLVKPEGKIIDYLTKHSGVTKEMLRGVTITLEQVQRQLQFILPSDAILCGQSLSFDLHALKMFHPYIIDTSIIFTESCAPFKKKPLKTLAKIYLKNSIIDDNWVHGPIEDSIVTMKLVHFRLGNALPSVNMRGNENVIHRSLTNQSNTFLRYVKEAKRKMQIVGNMKSIDRYSPELISNAKKIPVSNREEIISETAKNLKCFYLTISHLPFPSETLDSLSTLDSDIQQLYDACPKKSLFLVFLSTYDDTKFEEIRHSLCMIQLKNRE